jgi:hypothetical protein
MTILHYNILFILYLLKDPRTFKIGYLKYFNIFTTYNYIFNKVIVITTLNIFLSVQYLFLKKILATLRTIKTTSKQFLNKPNIHFSYTKSVETVSLPFSKNKLTKVIYLKFIILTSYYYNYLQTFKLNTTNIPLSSDFYFFTFLNLFYFKIRNQ